MKFLLVIFQIFLAAAAFSQDLRSSLLQYQFNALPLNPAYAGRLEVPGFDANYFGNFASSFQLSRAAQVSVHGRSERAGKLGQAGWGGVLQFYQQNFYGEINLRPAYSRVIELPVGTIAFGGTLGLSYFDIDENVISTVNSSFMTVDGGFGVYYHTDRFFAGVSVLNAFEKSFFLDENLQGNALRRENPFNLHTGSIIRLTEDLKIKPVALLRYANIYELPDRNQTDIYQSWSADVNASVIVQDTYVLGLLAGYTKPEVGFELSRFGVSATYIFGNLRLSYAIQQNNQAQSAISLPVSHWLSAGYDFYQDENEVPARFF
jgi:hypothetical protein